MIYKIPGFLWSHDLAPPQPPSPLPSASCLFQSSYVSPVELTNGRKGEGWGRQIIRPRESLVLKNHLFLSDYTQSPFGNFI